MSEASQGPGWWLASDGRWYPPAQAPGYVPESSLTDTAAVNADTDSATPPGFGQPTTGPDTTSGYGYTGYTGYTGIPGPPSGGLPPDYGYASQQPPPYYPYPPNGYYPDARMPYPMGPMVQAHQTNSFAIASLVCACVGIIPFLGILGVILGFVFGLIAKGQIKRTGGIQGGNGLATAGIIVSVAITALWIIFSIVVASSNNQICTTGNC